MFLAPSTVNQTRNYETDCSNHHPSLSTLRSKGLSRSKMIYVFLEISPRILEKKGIIVLFCTRSVTIIFIVIFFLLRIIWKAFTPSLSRMFSYWEHLFILTVLFAGMFSKSSFFLIKSVECMTYDLSYLTCGSNWWSMYFKIFVVSQCGI